jgi:tetratricopeptide (TPR) repeat protein
MKLKKTLMVCVWLFTTVFCFAQQNLSRGEELMMHNKPAEAVTFLERAVAENPNDPKAWLFLGIVFEQLGKSDDAIATYRQILPRAGGLSANVASNLGNVYFRNGNTDMAEQFYSQAINFNSVYPNAYLGRANTRIKTGNLNNAITDYEKYLSLEPSSSQRAKIEQLISIIRTEAAAAERKRIMEEEEARRLAEERQRLLDSVSASLQSVADHSKGLSSGNESVEHYDGEFELE